MLRTVASPETFVLAKYVSNLRKLTIITNDSAISWQHFLEMLVSWLRQEPLGDMTTVSFVNVLGLLIRRSPTKHLPLLCCVVRGKKQNGGTRLRERKIALQKKSYLLLCPYDTAITSVQCMSEEFAPFQLCCSSEGGKFFFSLPKKREVTLKLPF